MTTAGNHEYYTTASGSYDSPYIYNQYSGTTPIEPPHPVPPSPYSPIPKAPDLSGMPLWMMLKRRRC